MNLIDELNARGYSLRHEGGGNYRVKGHSGLIIKSHCWYHHSKGIGGRPIELIAELENNLPTISYYTKKKTLDFAKKTLTLKGGPRPAFDKHTRKVECYLIRQRHLDAIFIHQLIHQKIIFQDIYENACFAGYDENNNLKCLSIRATSSQRRQQKMDLAGSDKRYSFMLKANKENANLIITESPIDALSIACLENLKNNQGYFQSHKLALCGVNIKHLLERVEKIAPRKIWIACDCDHTGKELSQKIYSLLHHNVPTQIIQINQGKDPNDLLKLRRTLSI